MNKIIAYIVIITAALVTIRNLYQGATNYGIEIGSAAMEREYLDDQAKEHKEPRSIDGPNVPKKFGKAVFIVLNFIFLTGILYRVKKEKLRGADIFDIGCGDNTGAALCVVSVIFEIAISAIFLLIYLLMKIL